LLIIFVDLSEAEQGSSWQLERKPATQQELAVDFILHLADGKDVTSLARNLGLGVDRGRGVWGIPGYILSDRQMAWESKTGDGREIGKMPSAGSQASRSGGRLRHMRSLRSTMPRLPDVCFCNFRDAGPRMLAIRHIWEMEGLFEATVVVVRRVLSCTFARIRQGRQEFDAASISLQAPYTHAHHLYGASLAPSAALWSVRGWSSSFRMWKCSKSRGRG
jgi:hypothetical protein